MRAAFAALSLAAVAACAGRAAPNATPAALRAPAPSGAAAAAPGPRTRAERTGYAETSRYADVVAFVDSLARLAPGVLRVSSMGTTGEGRAIPVVVASRPAVATPEEARRSGRPVVYVQANIHAGEVEGKEALQALLRDLALAPGPNVLDSLVLVAVPIYNADGNERFRDQSVNRTEQNGPALVGQRANAAGLDLNRDYVKAEAPETRAALALVARWDPDVFVDLHTTDGSYHGYALTWSPSLHPAAPLGAYEQDTLLPRVAERVLSRRGFRTFPYGNFAQEYGADVNADTTKQGWYTYESRARFGTNYYGLRGRLSVLSEAFSHDPFERRVRSTYAFVAELLSALAEPEARERALASRPSAPGAARPVPVVLRTRLTPAPRVGPVLAEDLVRVPDSARTEPGVPRGLRRTGRIRTVEIPIYDRFVATRSTTPPLGGWAFPADAPGAAEAVALLRRHGVQVDRRDRSLLAVTSAFRVDTVVRAGRAFQGHHEVRVEGTWQTGGARRLRAGMYFVPSTQPLALLAGSLLEPETDDGLVTWNVWDAGLRAGSDFPVVRVTAPIAVGEMRSD